MSNVGKKRLSTGNNFILLGDTIYSVNNVLVKKKLFPLCGWSKCARRSIAASTITFISVYTVSSRVRSYLLKQLKEDTKTAFEARVFIRHPNVSLSLFTEFGPRASPFRAHCRSNTIKLCYAVAPCQDEDTQEINYVCSFPARIYGRGSRSTLRGRIQRIQFPVCIDLSRRARRAAFCSNNTRRSFLHGFFPPALIALNIFFFLMHSQ